MTGYVRVDTSNNIADGNVISAADLDNEFDGIQAAFNASTGHNHDGTTGEGAPISVLGPTQDVVVGASTVTPKTTNTVDIGSSSLKFKDLYLAGNASIGGTLAVTGATTLSAALTYGGVTLSNAVTGTGNMVLSASPTFTGTLAAAAANFSGNVTLGDASTDTVTVNGYMGVGGAGNPGRGIQVVSTALTGGDQIGVYSNATASSSATTALRSFYSVPKTAIAAFTCANIYSFSADDASLGAGSSVTNLVGVQIADQTQGTNNYGLRSLVSSGTNKWNIYASGTAQNYFAGNVGIGTTAFANSTLRVSTTDGTYPLGVSGTTKGLRIVTSATDVRLDAVDNTLAASYEPLYLNGSIVKFGTSLTERMRLDSTGLGIGTSSPTNALSVTGSANITGNTTLGDATTDTVTVNGYMSVGNTGSSATGLWVRNNALIGTTVQGFSSFPVGTTSNTTSVAAIVTSPGTAASAYTTNSVFGMYVGDVAKGAGSTINNQFGITIADQTQGASNTGLVSQVSSGTNKWNIYASGTATNYFAGDVGIGTAFPAQALVVLRNTGTSGLESGISVTNNIDSNLFIRVTGTGATDKLASIATSVATSLTFATNSSERMRINSSGRVLIGTTSASGSNLLQVNSDALINGLTVGKGLAGLTTNTAFGVSALAAVTTGSGNVALGYQALDANTTGQNNIAIGNNAIGANQTAQNLIAIGSSALVSATAGDNNIAIGANAMNGLVTGGNNVVVGASAMAANTSGAENTAVGYLAASSNTTGSNNTSLGRRALWGNTTTSNNVAIGYFALDDVLTGGNGTAVGYNALGAATGGNNTALGYNAGAVATTGTYNLFLGTNAGAAITTGGKNVVIGSYQGNSGGLDIRTSSNYIVLSDGDANIRQVIDSSGNSQTIAGSSVVWAPAPASISTTATLTNANIQGQIINTTGTSYTVTMPLGSTLETLVPWATTDLGYNFTVINTASGTITMAVNTGVTSLGALTIATGTSAQFRIRRTAANTFVLYRMS